VKSTAISRISEESLQSYVASVPAGALPDRTRRWVGLFRVEETEEYGGAIYLYTSHGFLDRHGIAFLPPGTTPAPRMSVRHLFGPWYNFTWRF